MQIIFSLDFVYAYGAGCIHSGITLTALTGYDDAGMRRFFQRSRNALRATLVIAVQMLSTTVFTGWLLYVWAQNSHFGPQPDCSHVVKYVFFFASVPATATWLRTLLIVGIVFAAFSLLFKFSTIVFVKMGHFEEQFWRRVPDAKSSSTDGKSIYKRFLTLPVGCVSPIGSLPSYFLILFVSSAVYGVTTLELIVRCNLTSGKACS